MRALIQAGLAGFVVACGLANVASADPITIGGVAVDAANGWRYYPAMQGNQVVGLLSEQLENGQYYGAYTTLWHQKLSDGTWSTSGYKGPVADAALLLASGNPGMTFDKALLPNGGPVTCEPPDTTTFEQLQYGLSLNDPLLVIAEECTPEQVEFLVVLGAEGAVGVSGMFVAENDPTGVTMSIDAFLTDVRAFAQHSLDEINPSSPPPNLYCWPGTRVTTSEVPAPGSVWAVAGPNLCGECTYTRASNVYTTTCTMTTACVSTCTTTGPVAGVMTRTGMASNGTCPASP